MLAFGGVCARDFVELDPTIFQRLSPAYQAHQLGRVIVFAEHGTRPTSTPDGTVVVSGDLRLTNKAELRRRFAPDLVDPDDLELSLRMYRQLGRSFVRELRGEFSVVVVDLASQTITMATDRLALKPLYLAEIGGDLVWGSVASLVAQHPGYQFAVDEARVAQFLFGLDHDTSGSFYRGIRRLQPASIIQVTPTRLTTSRYWEPSLRTTNRVSAVEAAEQFREVLGRAIRSRYRPGKTGILLSGGVDSASIACLAADLNLDLITHSLRFPGDAAADEGAQIEKVIRQCGFRHETIEIDPPLRFDFPFSFDSGPGLPDLLYFPNLQMHAPQFSAMSAAGLDTSFDGIGGDQLLGHRLRHVDRRLSGLTTADLRRELISPLAPRIARLLNRRWRSDSLLSSSSLLFALMNRLWRFCEPAWVPFSGSPTKRAVIESVCRSVSLLRNVEQLSLLAHQFGIDTRSPYLDTDVLEYVLSLPTDTAFSAGETKGLLRQAMHGTLPESIRVRQDKAEFSRWFDHDIVVRQAGQVSELVDGYGKLVEFMLTPAGRADVLKYLDNDQSRPSARWICANWVNIARWWRSASEGAFYVRERAGSAAWEERQDVAEAGSQALG